MGRSYLYGDGRPSHHTTNVLELIEQAVDFCVAALEVAAHRDDDESQREARERRIQASRDKLQRLGQRLCLQLREAVPADEPSLVAWSIMVERDIGARLKEQDRALREQLGRETAAADGALDEAHDSWREPLFRLLRRSDFPGASQSLRIDLVAGRYAAQRLVRTSWGLLLSFDLDTARTPWGEGRRVDDFGSAATRLRRSSEIGRALVTRVTRGGGKTTVTLAAGRQGEAPIEVVFGGPGRIFLFDRAERGEGARPQVPEGAMQEILARFGSAVDAGLDELARRPQRLAEARLDDRRLDTVLPEMVGRLIAQLAPEVQLLAQRSPNRHEFVLKRVLDEGRREELFLSRRDLVERIARLPKADREAFAPLGLNVPPDDTLPSANSETGSLDSTPAFPRPLPRVYEPSEGAQERTAHGPGTPSMAPLSEATPPSEATLVSSADGKPPPR